MPDAARVGPWLLDGDRPLERDVPDLGRDSADGLGRDAAAPAHRLGRVLRIAVALGQ